MNSKGMGRGVMGGVVQERMCTCSLTDLEYQFGVGGWRVLGDRLRSEPRRKFLVVRRTHGDNWRIAPN